MKFSLTASYLPETPKPRNKINVTEYILQAKMLILKVSFQMVMIGFEQP